MEMQDDYNGQPYNLKDQKDDKWAELLWRERKDIATYADLTIQHDKLFGLLRALGKPAIKSWSATLRDVWRKCPLASSLPI